MDLIYVQNEYMDPVLVEMKNKVQNSASLTQMWTTGPLKIKFVLLYHRLLLSIIATYDFIYSCMKVRIG